MFVKELFDKNNITCPQWLVTHIIDDEWIDSEYSFEKNFHKWIIKNKLKNAQITFDGKTFTLGAYFEDIFHILERITEEYVMIS